MKKELDRIKLEQQQAPASDIQTKMLNKEDVEKAIDEYIIRNGRVLRQTIKTKKVCRLTVQQQDALKCPQQYMDSKDLMNCMKAAW